METRAAFEYGEPKQANHGEPLETDGSEYDGGGSNERTAVEKTA